MSALENLCRMLLNFEQSLAKRHSLQPTDHPYMPLLWLDYSAWQRTLSDSALPIVECPLSAVPQAWRECAIQVLGVHAGNCHWLLIELDGHEYHLPMLLYEDMKSALAVPWQSLEGPAQWLQNLDNLPEGNRFLRHELGLTGSIYQTMQDFNGATLVQCFELLLEHARTHWGSHGLLCLASDLLRLLVLTWLPGAYGDLGDVVGKMKKMPTPHRTQIDISKFCAHRTIAIENDLIFCHDQSLMMAIVWGTGLWSVQTVRRIAAKLNLLEPSQSPPALLGAVLPHLDKRLPIVPDLRILFNPPYTRLADYINIAYGSHALFGQADAVQPFFTARNGKEQLINHVAGFTGYQKFAHHLVPGHTNVWARCEAELGLTDYAPQLGWRSYGFGTVDRMVGHGEYLFNDHAHAGYARRELAALAVQLNMEANEMESLAVLSFRIHSLLSKAHFHPIERQACLTQVKELCSRFEQHSQSV